MDRRDTRLAFSTGGEKPVEPEKRTPSPLPRLTVRLEKRPSNRTVTIVRGLPERDIEALAGKLKSYCATGGSYEGTTLTLQGDHEEKVEAWLKLQRRKHGR